MKVLLICSAGMSTSVLVTKMRGFAAGGDVIEEKAFTELNDAIDDFDVVLVGPQMGFRFPAVNTLCQEKGKAAAKIDMMVYGRCDGEKAYAQAKALYESLGK